ncbi:DUF2306 domain-containing protein [Marivita hallyeonensis]|uniref:Uncharacterized membrane protein n=1 Tax=Marivita hallyeonensis TaxID=996342 RepID=A0A1M5PF53_9RHOB|nr:DUF2306 domain-containing protein [Marivita hallyeonensis]SHH00347.1 Uncharacterized membrane protein [Marivita hallyeonensis]
MTLVPLFNGSVAIQIHVIAALIGMSVGAFALYRPRRDRVHKVLGYVWVIAMAVLALSAFAIPSTLSPVGLGPLHVFAVITLLSLWTGVRHAIRREFAAHEAVFRSLYTYGLIVAGLLTVMPERTLNRVVFPDAPQLGWLPVTVCVLWVCVRLARPRKHDRLQG